MTRRFLRALGAIGLTGFCSAAFAASMAITFTPSASVGNAAPVTATVSYAGVTATSNGTQVVVCYDNTKLTFGAVTYASPPGESQPSLEQASGLLCASPANRQILLSYVSFGGTWPSNPAGSGTLAAAGNLASITFTTANPFTGTTNVTATENTALGGNYALGTTSSTLTKTITASTANFTIGNVTVTEGGGSANAVVTCNGAFASNTITPVNVAFTVGNGTGNFTTSASPVAFTACGGQTQNIAVTARTNDTTIQGTVTGSITLGAVTTDTGSTVSPTASVVTVNDNDALPSIAVTASGGCAEALVPTNCTFTVIATSNTNPAQTGAGPSVAFGLTGTATNNTDYKLVSGASCAGAAFTGPITTTFGTPSVMTVCVTDDNIAESGGETVILTLTANAAAYTLIPSSATNTIADDDSPQAVSVTVAGSPAAENGGILTYNFARTGGSAGAQAATLTVNVTPPPTNSRYNTTCGTTVTFAAAAPTASCTVTAVNDNVVTGAITVNVAVAPASVTGAYTVGTSPAVGQILDDDQGVTVTAVAASVTEGGNAVFNLNCGGATGFYIVSYTITGADAGVVITPSATSASINCTGQTGLGTVVTVPTVNDIIVGNTRTVTLTITGVVAANVTAASDRAKAGQAGTKAVVVGTPSSASVQVVDNDVPTTIPTMNAAGLGLMSLMLIGLAAFQRRRRQQ